MDVTLASNSGNSRVYKASAGTKNYGLKEYPEIKNDPRNRLQTEQRALDLMRANNITSVPHFIAHENNYALMSWIDGGIIKEPNDTDIDGAASFLKQLHTLESSNMPLASEACLSGEIIVSQIEKRLEALSPYTAENPALQNFLNDNFLPAFSTRRKAADHKNFTAELPQNERTLIAADFGFHNIMKSPDGALHFIDFEYFGWDDPVKLMSDFLLHPATPLTSAQAQRFSAAMLATYGEAAKARFTRYYPLFGLRWALILLNEFIPSRWQARAHAKGHTDWETVKTQQLAKAEKMLKQSEKFL